MDKKETVWRALGEYLNRQLAGKKGVVVPHFGTFTWTSPPVDLEGVTNPEVRERDQRDAVFIVASDFAGNVRPGIAHSTGIRPYTAQGFSGKVPTLTLNYTQLSLLSHLDKSLCKRTLDEIIQSLSSSARSHQDIRESIPFIGTFVVKSGIAAVIFDLVPPSKLEKNAVLSEGKSGSVADTIERPLTASAKTAHSSLNYRSLLTSPIDFLLENRSKLLLLMQLKDQINSGFLPFEELFSCIQTLENPTLTFDFISQLVYMTNSKQGNKVRYRDFFAGIQSYKTPNRPKSVSSDVTGDYTRTSIVPLARKIWEKKLVLTEIAQKKGMRPRVKGSLSQVLAVLKQGNVNVNIHQLKAVLREEQVDASAVSVLDLISTVRSILKPESGDLSVFSGLLTSRSSVPPPPVTESSKLDAFFRAHPLTLVFFRARNDQDLVTLPSFLSAIDFLSNHTIPSFEAQRVFLQASNGKHELTAQEFWQAFQPQETLRQTQERCFRILRQWLRESQLTAEEGFQWMLDKVGASEKLTKSDLEEAMKGFNVSKQDVEIVFSEVDAKKDGYVDLSEWLGKMYETESPYQPLKDILNRINAPKDETITPFLGLENRTCLTESDLISLLQRLNSRLTPSKSFQIASSILRNRTEIPVSELISQISNRNSELTIDWLDRIYRKIRRKLNGQTMKLRNRMEKKDGKKTGRLTLEGFAQCLQEEGLGLEQGEVQRLLKILDPRDIRIIDYLSFLDNLTGPEFIPTDPLRATTDRLQAYMRQNGLSIEQLLTSLGGSVPILTFANFLRSKVQKRISVQEMTEIASKMDHNKDGFIDWNDLETVLMTRNRVEITGKNPELGVNMSTEQVRALLVSIKDVMTRKKMSFAEAYGRLDRESSGVVSYEAFVANWDAICPLSVLQKNALFGLMDGGKTGLIDYPAFLRILRDVAVEPERNESEWNWEQDVIAKIRLWKNTHKITTDDLFNAFDRDFDGVINKTDLAESLQILLKIDNLTPEKTDRIYKLMDIFQRNSIQLVDFRSIFDGNKEFDWISNAKLHLSRYLIQKYGNMTSAFEELSEHSGKLTFSGLKSVVDKENLLSGFGRNLQEIFTSIDTYRKGFLSLSDWLQSFSQYDQTRLLFTEFLSTLQANFDSISSAFEYFLSFHFSQNPGKIDFNEFELAVNSLFLKRFNKTDVRNLWTKIAKNRTFLDFEGFESGLNSNSSFLSFKMKKNGKNTGKRPSLRSFSQSKLAVLSEDDPFLKLKNRIKSLSRPLEDFFRDIDMKNTGKITKNDFKSVLLRLNLGLNSTEIEQLTLRSDLNRDNSINWPDFIRKIQPNDTEIHLKSQIELKMTHIKALIMEFFGNPRDVFRKYDKEKTGKMEFPAFLELIRSIYERKHEEIPGFSVLKELFRYIDTRKDGYLDIIEWLNVFKREFAGNSLENSHLMEEISKIIGKNWRMLQLTFDAMSKDGRVTYQGTKDVLSTVLKEMNLTEEQWRAVVKVGEREGGVEYKRLLDIYRERALSKTQSAMPNFRH